MRLLLIAVGLISLGTDTEPLGAQGRLLAGGGAGIAMPSGVMQDQTNPGWHALVTLDAWLPDMPASLRVDAAYARFGFRSAPVGSTEQVPGARIIASVSLSLSVGSPDSLSKVSPYALGGLTMNRIGCSETASEAADCSPASQMGFSAGLGARFGLFGRRGFADARLHCVARWVKDLCYIPVTVGLLFWSHDVGGDVWTSDGR